MNSVMKTISKNNKEIIIDNNFLFTAFQNRLSSRIVHIFDKYKIPINKNLLNKNLEENLVNVLVDFNVEINKKHVKLLCEYEKIVWSYIDKKADTQTIKKATMSFIDGISKKNNESITMSVSSNFVEYINSIIFVYDNAELNREVLNRVNTDLKDILDEFKKTNYNFVIESINSIIKNIISSM